ncbi:PQQ-dependent sugar dehydrogenase [Salicibibacter halophilus]|uniref:PQQ-dependent sugar dehydrogenase n=1 Tax=Salicibibacter halophilus TaxID=2502791 RepID=A0A514LJN0_9BACI|nr:PQQ-dependent sugar dehydrogenase [Salicibibacter halophilus]QDI92066.1 PQQ-dependent sugar dehydrogenase [Salicibibacter halophilus]
MKKYMVLGLSAALVGCAPEEEEPEPEPEESGEQEEAADEEEEEPGFDGEDYEELATDLEAPWSLAKTDDDEFFITERAGAIVHFDGEDVTREDIELNEAIWDEGEGGLLGMALDPESDESGVVYHTYEDEEDEVLNRIVAIERDDDGWQETDVLLDEIPGDTIHNGGRLAIGPDDHLYATTGDADVEELSQDAESLAGNILRMELDGSVPEDNPFDDSYVYSYGHRNAQGIDWSDDERMFSSEHGPTAQDEVNEIEAGNNYGWPEITGDEEAEDMESPVFESGDDTWAPSGAAFVGENDFYVAGLAGEELLRFDVEEDEMDTVLEDEGRLRDVLFDGDDLYVLTNNTDGRGDPGEDDDRLLRLAD